MFVLWYATTRPSGIYRGASHVNDRHDENACGNEFFFLQYLISYLLIQIPDLRGVSSKFMAEPGEVRVRRLPGNRPRSDILRSDEWRIPNERFYYLKFGYLQERDVLRTFSRKMHLSKTCLLDLDSSHEKFEVTISY